MIHKLPKPKWDRPPANNKKVNMEDKLLSPKEQFCKWYCPNKDAVYNSNENCDRAIKCDDCGEITICEQSNGYIELCNECKVEDFIVFIRDEL